MEQSASSFFIKHSLKPLWLLGLAFMSVVALATYLIVQAPDDYQHGITGKILYIHVPSAWMATLGYMWMAGCAIVFVFRQSPIAYLLLVTAAPIGAVFTLLTLVTGALWGMPAWGTWWVWDARLTSVLLLFWLYLAILLLKILHRQMSAAIITLFGFCLVPIIKFSVVWWQTMHQPTSLWRAQGAAIEAAMLLPLIPTVLAFVLLFVMLQWLALRAHMLKYALQFMPAAVPHLLTPNPLSPPIKKPEYGAKTQPIPT